MLVDSHCHLDYLTSADAAWDVTALLERARCQGVGHVLTVAVDGANQQRVLEHARRHANVFASAGIHPAAAASERIAGEELLALADDPGVVAIGETGLDYFHGADTAELQQQSFVTHLRVAARAGLPVIVHTREASDDTLRLMRQHADTGSAGVMHCFTESLAMARAAIELNFMVSFSGIITFRSAAALREVVRELPLERILVETDSPYLAPVPHRGQRNEPAYVSLVAAAVAAIKGIAVEEVADTTTANFFRLFRRAHPA
jgi:TatD DNase family protein